MPSAVLIQSPKDQRVESDLGIRIDSVESHIDHISLSKGAADRGIPSEGAFGFDVSMTETSRMKDGLSVRYSFAFGKTASGQNCRISGKAVFHFSRLNPDSDLPAFGSEVDNEMAVAIFKENYETIYLLHKSLGLEPPSPWITQDVSLSSRSAAA